MKSFNAMQKTRSSRRFLGGKRLFWLGFVFPCFGVAQDAALEPAAETQVAVKEEAAAEIVAAPEKPVESAQPPQTAAPKRSSMQGANVIGVQVPAPAPECYAEPKPTCSPCAPVQCPPCQTCAPAPRQTRAPAPCQTCAPAPCQTCAPAPCQTCAPAPRQTRVPAPCQTCVPAPCQTCAPAPVAVPPPGKLCPKDRDCWPAPNGSITLEFLYFKAILENLRYGAKYPFQVEHPNYTIANIEQGFKYDPGGRVTVGFTLDNYWELDLAWTYFKADPGTRSATDPQQILTFMNTTVLGTTGASTSNSLNGKWDMTMNVINVDVKKPFCIGQALMFAPVVGVQAALFDNKLSVTYPGTTNTSGATIPQNISGKNTIWAVGPEIAIESRFLARRKLDLYLRGAYSAMLGNFMAKVHYSNMINPSPAEPVEIRDNSTAVFSMVQIQAAVSKRWQVGKGLIELAAGWETQVWSGINRWDYYSTINVPSVAGDLMLAGPFIKFFASF